jgi:ectoine hydroxylase-related dioxygenase (phytanoyl-CoA dioxygenase family)
MGIREWFTGKREKAARALDAEQRAFWDANGYLILRGFVTPEEIATVRAVVDDEWQRKPGNDHEVDVNTGPLRGRAYKMHSVDPEARQEVYKLNNLFGRRPEIRRVALSPRLKQACAELLDGEPLICNSLNFERGSQQDFHIDTWYMPPPVEGKMVVASIAIDDVDADNGPVAYYAGSHKIPPYRFSDGRLNEIPAEKAQCREYLDREIAARGLEVHEMRGKSGDVLLWHAQLLHAGRPIRDMHKTRSSLVVHYWRKQDLPRNAVREDPAAGAYLAHTLRGEISF